MSSCFPGLCSKEILDISFWVIVRDFETSTLFYTFLLEFSIMVFPNCLEAYFIYGLLLEMLESLELTL